MTLDKVSTLPDISLTQFTEPLGGGVGGVTYTKVPPRDEVVF